MKDDAKDTLSPECLNVLESHPANPVHRKISTLRSALNLINFSFLGGSLLSIPYGELFYFLTVSFSYCRLDSSCLDSSSIRSHFILYFYHHLHLDNKVLYPLSLMVKRHGLGSYTSIGKKAFGKQGVVVFRILFILELFFSAAAFLVLISDSLVMLYPSWSPSIVKALVMLVIAPVTLIKNIGTTIFMLIFRHSIVRICSWSCCISFAGCRNDV
jgi:hypothetical protein